VILTSKWLSTAPTAPNFFFAAQRSFGTPDTRLDFAQVLLGGIEEFAPLGRLCLAPQIAVAPAARTAARQRHRGRITTQRIEDTPS
jgi:hypothetical protein